jgi:hypothetical protein
LLARCLGLSRLRGWLFRKKRECLLLLDALCPFRGRGLLRGGQKERLLLLNLPGLDRARRRRMKRWREKKRLLFFYLWSLTRGRRMGYF